MPRRKISQPRALIARLFAGYLAAEKRSSDQIWRAPGGENPIWPDPPTLPDPPGASRKGSGARQFVPDYSRRAIIRVFLLTLGLFAIGLALIAVQSRG
jgi:hypothetical protein